MVKKSLLFSSLVVWMGTVISPLILHAACPTTNVVNVSNWSQLQNAVSSLTSNRTICLAPGTYTVSGTDAIYLPQNISNVTIMGSTGNRDDVIVRGSGMTSGPVRFGFWTQNVDGLTLKDMTIRDFSEHPVLINSGSADAKFQNLRLLDGGDQLIKVTSGGGVDNGLVEDCEIGYTTIAPDNYTNGVDVHTGQNWIIRRNTFKNFRSNDGILVGPAILIWNNSANTLVENNLFINNSREISLGLVNHAATDHSGGIVRNNIIHRPSNSGGDVAILICDSPNTKVLNNTIKLNGSYSNAVEYRFSQTTGVEIRNNLTDAAIVMRDGASGTVLNNVTNAAASLFVSNSNNTAPDLHLVSGASAAIDKAVTHTSVTTDFDEQQRPQGGAPDLGADEFGTGGGGGGVSCDLNNDTFKNVADVQLCVNQALTPANCSSGDINGDGLCNVIDVQRIVNGALGGICP